MRIHSQNYTLLQAEKMNINNGGYLLKAEQQHTLFT